MRALRCLFLMLACLPVLSQIFLPHRHAISITEPFNPGNENTNLLGIVTGEHPVLYSNKVYVAQWAYYGGTGGVSRVDAFNATIDQTVNIVDNFTDAAPARDVNGKWHVWSANGKIWRTDLDNTLAAEDSRTSLGAVDWESLTTSSDLKSVIVVDGSGRIQALSVTNYTTSIWTNTSATFDLTTSPTPSITRAGGYYWVLDHRGKLWKLLESDGSTSGSLQPFAATVYQYFTPLYDAGNTNVYFADGTGGHVMCADADAMTNKWTYSSGMYVHRAACYSSNRLYVALLDTPAQAYTKIVCLNATNGTAIWTNTYGFSTKLKMGTPLIDNDYFWMGTYDANKTNMHYLVGIDLSTGETKSAVPLTFNASSGVPQIWKGKAFCPLWTNGMQAIKVRTAGTGDDRLWKSDTNHTGNITYNSSGSLIYDDTPGTLPLANLVAHWKMNETSGDRADSAGSYTLTDNLSVGSAQGVKSLTAQFDRTLTNYLSSSDNVFKWGAASFTYTGWLRVDAGGNSILGRWGNAGLKEYVLFINTGDYSINFYGSTDGSANAGPAIATTFGTVPLHAWLFVACGRNAATSKLFISVNGGVIQEASCGNLFQGVNTFKLGWGGTGASDSLSGGWDEVAVWNKALDSTEITALWNRGVPPNF